MSSFLYIALDIQLDDAYVKEIFKRYQILLEYCADNKRHTHEKFYYCVIHGGVSSDFMLHQEYAEIFQRILLDCLTLSTCKVLAYWDRGEKVNLFSYDLINNVFLNNKTEIIKINKFTKLLINNGLYQKDLLNPLMVDISKREILNYETIYHIEK